MILDSSAIVAILCAERDHEILMQKIDRAATVAVGAPTVFETALVVSGKLKTDGLALVQAFLTESDIAVIPFTERQMMAAYGAYMRFGKGHHKAALNFGDCLSYATAVTTNMPLLFVGRDFPRTDIRPA